VDEEAGESEPIHLELVDALELYGLIIGASADQAADQLRDAAGLESALARPQMYRHYEAADLALQASVLAHGIAESQTFVDGNKRLALVAMLTFLSVNGYLVEVSDPDLAEWIISFSAQATPEHVAEHLRSALRPNP
jgi:death on curing protein